MRRGNGKTPRELEKKADHLKKVVAKLSIQSCLVRSLNEALRFAKRQAAPFGRRVSQAAPGEAGPQARASGASQPIPDHVGEDIIAPLEACPCCGGAVTDVVDHGRFVVDLPKVEPNVRRIATQSGHCEQCRKRVRARIRTRSQAPRAQRASHSGRTCSGSRPTSTWRAIRKKP